MPTGICNAPPTLQALIISILYNHMDKFVVVYIEYSLLYSKYQKNHFYHFDIFSPGYKSTICVLVRMNVTLRLRRYNLFDNKLSKKNYQPGRTVFRTSSLPKIIQIAEVCSFRVLLQFLDDLLSVAIVLALFTKITGKKSTIRNWNENRDVSFHFLIEQVIFKPRDTAIDWWKYFRHNADVIQVSDGGRSTQLRFERRERVIAKFCQILNIAEENHF